MRLRRSVVLSVRELMAHRLRTALALSAVGMGVAGVLLAAAVGQGAEAEVRRDIQAAGENLLVVRPAQIKRSAARRVKGVVTTLRLEDYHAITSGDVHAGLRFLVDHLPPALHLVLLSRGEPPLPLARWRARGELNELTAQLRYAKGSCRGSGRGTSGTFADAAASPPPDGAGEFTMIRSAPATG